MSSATVTTVRELVQAVGDRSVHQVTVALPGVDPEEARALQQRINEQLAACGCTEGSAGLFAATGAGLAAWQMGWLELHGWATVAAIATLAFLGIGVGKTIGHHRGRLRARRLASNFARSLQGDVLQRNSAHHGRVLR